MLLDEDEQLEADDMLVSEVVRRCRLGLFSAAEPGNAGGRSRSSCRGGDVGGGGVK